MPSLSSLYPISWTKIETYINCPLVYKHKYILKDLPWVETEAIKWGNAVHKAMELNLTEQKPLEGRFQFLNPMADKLNAMPGDHYAEMEMAVDASLLPVGYWDKDCWARGKMDRTVIKDTVGFSFDYKSGKRKDTFSHQLSLAAVFVFATWPQLIKLGVAYLWTQGGKPTQRILTRDEVPAIKAQFDKWIADMEWSYEHDAFPAKPSGLCKKHCEVFSCIHNGRKSADG